MLGAGPFFFLRGGVFSLVGGGIFLGVFFMSFLGRSLCSLLGLFRSFCPKLPGDRILLCTVHFGIGFPGSLYIIIIIASGLLFPIS